MRRHYLLGLCLFAGTSAYAGVSPAVQERLAASPDARLDVLVHLKAQADLAPAELVTERVAKQKFIYKALTDTALNTQDGVLKELAGESDVKVRRFYVKNMIALRGAPAALIKKLAARSDVAKVSLDPSVKVVKAATAEQLSNEPALEAVGANISRTGADRVWATGNRGEGIVVAGADTGIEWDHPGLKTHYRGWSAGAASHDYNWRDAITEALTEAANPCGYATREPCDDNAHGTHTIGTVVGDDGAGNQVGMAPGATWIGCRNMDAGTGKPSTYIDCFEYFLAPYPYGADPMRDGDPSKAPHVVNNSWGCPTSEGCDGDDFAPVLATLKEAGIMIVAAAGNAGSSCSTINDAPAHHTDAVFVVGAMDHRSDTIASFSSRGPSKFDNKISPDLTAPGVSVRSSIPGGSFSGSMWSGTSMASPHVAGAVALLWAHDEALRGDIDATVARFNQTAQGKTSTQTCGGVAGTQIPNNTFGHGIMNVYDAVTRTTH